MDFSTSNPYPYLWERHASFLARYSSCIEKLAKLGRRPKRRSELFALYYRGYFL